MYRKYFKRLFDLLLGALLLILLLPFLILISIAVLIDSGMPVFFVQMRGGKGGGFFRILKFRTMISDRRVETKGFEPGDRKRVTRVGRFLRKSKMDELPQLINVMRGEMSMVGPRPEVRKYIEIYPERWCKILSAMPGITDPASMIFRDEEEILAAAADPEREYIEKILPRKLDIYEKYVDNISFAGDVKIIIETIFVVLNPRG